MRILEGMALDESLPATQRMRAIEELGRIERQGRGVEPSAGAEVAADPFGEYDELAQARRERVAKQRRRAG